MGPGHNPLPPDLATAVAHWPEPAQLAFLHIRRIVLIAARDLPDLSLIETLKWGQPSWLPDRPRQGATLRAAWQAKRPDDIGLFVNCNTTLAETMRALYPADFSYEGRRGLYVALAAPLPEQAIAHCAVLTLTYHRKTA